MRILLVDDEQIVRENAGNFLRTLGHWVDEVSDGVAALALIESGAFDLAVVDVRMPRMDGFTLLARLQQLYPHLAVILITGYGDLDTAVKALRLGAVDFLTKPFRNMQLEAAVTRALQVQFLRREQHHLRDTIRGLQTTEAQHARNRLLVGSSRATHQLREQIRQAVEADCQTILLTGETGTGKEVVARALHSLGSGEERPFIAVNCPSLPESLAESELFGHVKGAFTGASSSRAGYFELAHGGTLFLDEVADLAPTIQARLLRVLETRSFRRVGGTAETEVQVRVIAAANTCLETQVENRAFRRDLYYRLNGYPIHLLPLRERQEDILPLADYFLSDYAQQRGLSPPCFSPAARERLLAYPFPGNARELRNLVERAAILCRSGEIQAEHLFLTPVPLAVTPSGASAAVPQVDPEHSRILQALEAARWNRKQAAANLGMSYGTLRHKMARFGIR